MRTIYVTKSQIERARTVDLQTYLSKTNPSELVHLCSGTYTTRTHDSLKISNGKWYWWSQGIGGISALDYMIRIERQPFPAAVALLCSLTDEYSAPHQNTPQKPSKNFCLPVRNSNNRRVLSYLKSRGIDHDILCSCIRQNQLYEDAAHHNCVFVGYQGIQPRYAALRSTLLESSFKGDVLGSDKRFSFAVPKCAGPSTLLCVFEGAIDALSYLTLLRLQEKDWTQANTLSLGGVYGLGKNHDMKLPAALERYLTDYPHIETVALCLDHDAAGQRAAAGIAAKLSDYTVLYALPQTAKDYNDVLKKQICAPT